MKNLAILATLILTITALPENDSVTPIVYVE